MWTRSPVPASELAARQARKTPLSKGRERSAAVEGSRVSPAGLFAIAEPHQTDTTMLLIGSNWAGARHAWRVIHRGESFDLRIWLGAILRAPFHAVPEPILVSRATMAHRPSSRMGAERPTSTSRTARRSRTGPSTRERPSTPGGRLCKARVLELRGLWT